MYESVNMCLTVNQLLTKCRLSIDRDVGQVPIKMLIQGSDQHSTAK